MAPKKSATAGAKAKPAGAGATPPKADAKKVDAAKKSARSPAPAPREEPFGTATPTILLLGAYGTVGSAIARTVLAQSSTAKLIIAEGSPGFRASTVGQGGGGFSPTGRTR